MKTLEEYLAGLEEDHKLDALKGFKLSTEKYHQMIDVAKQMSKKYRAQLNAISDAMSNLKLIIHSKEYEELMQYYVDARDLKNTGMSDEEYNRLDGLCYDIDPGELEYFLRDLNNWVLKKPVRD